MPAYHLALDGEPERACVYRYTGTETIFESDEPVAARDVFQIYIYQTEYAPELPGQIIKALRDAGFSVTPGRQAMEQFYYREELTARIFVPIEKEAI